MWSCNEVIDIGKYIYKSVEWCDCLWLIWLIKKKKIICKLLASMSSRHCCAFNRELNDSLNLSVIQNNGPFSDLNVKTTNKIVIKFFGVDLCEQHSCISWPWVVNGIRLLVNTTLADLFQVWQLHTDHHRIVECKNDCRCWAFTLCLMCSVHSNDLNILHFSIHKCWWLTPSPQLSFFLKKMKK